VACRVQACMRPSRSSTTSTPWSQALLEAAGPQTVCSCEHCLRPLVLRWSESDHLALCAEWLRLAVTAAARTITPGGWSQCVSPTVQAAQGRPHSFACLSMHMPGPGTHASTRQQQSRLDMMPPIRKQRTRSTTHGKPPSCRCIVSGNAPASLSKGRLMRAMAAPGERSSTASALTIT